MVTNNQMYMCADQISKINTDIEIQNEMVDTLNHELKETKKKCEINKETLMNISNDDQEKMIITLKDKLLHKSDKRVKFLELFKEKLKMCLDLLIYIETKYEVKVNKKMKIKDDLYNKYIKEKIYLYKERNLQKSYEKQNLIDIQQNLKVEYFLMVCRKF